MQMRSKDQQLTSQKMEIIEKKLRERMMIKMAELHTIALSMAKEKLTQHKKVHKIRRML
jgi:hypothetical protein